MLFRSPKSRVSDDEDLIQPREKSNKLCRAAKLFRQHAHPSKPLFNSTEGAITPIDDAAKSHRSSAKGSRSSSSCRRSDSCRRQLQDRSPPDPHDDQGVGRPPAAQAWTQASRGCARVGAPPPAVLASHPTDASSDSAQSRKALNRASQRAFRDRKQEHVADLEAKVRLLEQGEGERSSFFQSMARTAKEEVTAMRAENDSLRSQLAALQAEKVRGERFGEVEERSRVRREPPRSEEDDLPSKRARRASTRLPDKVVLTYQEDSPSPSSSPVTAFAAVSPPPEEIGRAHV